MTRIVESENLKQEAVLGRLGISGVAGGGVGAGALAVMRPTWGVLLNRPRLS
jgi:hypothetical protein